MLEPEAGAKFDGSVVVWSNDPNQMLDIQVDVVTESWAIESSEIGGLQVTIGWGERFGDSVATKKSRWLVALTGDARLHDATIFGRDIDRAAITPDAVGDYNGEPAQFYVGSGPHWTILRGLPESIPVVVAQERTTIEMPSITSDVLFSLPGAPSWRDDLPVQGRWYDVDSKWFQADSGVERSSTRRVEDATPADDLISDTALIWGSDGSFTPSASLIDFSAQNTAERELFFGAILLGAAAPFAFEAILELIPVGIARQGSTKPASRRTALRSSAPIPRSAPRRLRRKRRGTEG